MLRRLHPEQPASFAFTEANRNWAEAQLRKYPQGREASAIIPLLWRAQEQEGWLTRPAIEYVARMVGLAYMRALEVATFYFMFQLQPVGKIANIQICGTTSCMLCGSEDLVSVCREKIAPNPHQLSKDGNFSWEEVECLGACANAPMAQIGKDYYEDLTAENFAALLDAMARGETPAPGPQNGRFASEPLGGPTSLTEHERVHDANASVDLARVFGDTLKRIDGTETADESRRFAPDETPTGTGGAGDGAHADDAAAPDAAHRPDLIAVPREGKADDLKKIKGVGPKLEGLLNSLGVWHFDQIASWSEEQIAWVDYNLEGFKGRIARDAWVSQARVLASGGTTEFAQRVERGAVPSSEG